MHDLVVIGAGPVGGTLALALAGHDLDVVALDARGGNAAPRGDRSLALSHGACLILDRLGLWQALAALEGAVTPIRAIDISQAGGFGVVRLEASEHGLPALGQVVSYAALQSEIDAALARSEVDLRFHARVDTVTGTPMHARIVASDGDARFARLAVVADGSGTSVAGIARTRHDYGQVALVASVWRDAPHEGVAYERFTADGPVALLPERDHYALVWTMTPARSEALLALDEPKFLRELGAHFGSRVTGFTRVAGRKSFPLALEHARPTVAARTVVVGNAAQQLHPVAGQGFNLGLRDAWELAQGVLDSTRDAIGSPAMLADYAMRRVTDRGAGIAFTHGLVNVFGNDSMLMRWPRGLALALLDAVPPAKRAFTRAMLYGVG